MGSDNEHTIGTARALMCAGIPKFRTYIVVFLYTNAYMQGLVQTQTHPAARQCCKLNLREHLFLRLWRNINFENNAKK